MEVRTAAIIAAEIARKRARRDALQFRQGEVASELETLREQHARALADGSEGTSRANQSAFVQEQDGIARALAMLATDIAALEAEHAALELDDAKQIEDEAIASAAAVLDRLDETLRRAITGVFLPEADAFTVAIKRARTAANNTDQRRRAAGNNEPAITNRAERASHRRGALLALVQQMRSYVAD